MPPKYRRQVITSDATEGGAALFGKATHLQNNPVPDADLLVKLAEQLSYSILSTISFIISMEVRPYKVYRMPFATKIAHFSATQSSDIFSSDVS